MITEVIMGKPSKILSEEQEVVQETTEVPVEVEIPELVEEVTTFTPEEGLCFLDGITSQLAQAVTYMNDSSVPVQDKCDDSCFCNNGDVICDKKNLALNLTLNQEWFVLNLFLR